MPKKRGGGSGSIGAGGASGTVTIDGIRLPVNPNSVKWDYKVKLATIKTVGGKVVQLLGWSMGDLMVSGHYGAMGVERQAEIFKHIDSIALRQAPMPGQRAAEPVRFLWPEMGWDFWVFVKGMQQGGASVSVERNERIHNPTYNLTLFVYEDNGDVISAAANSAASAYLKRLTAGLGWKQTDWNGPQTAEQLQELLGGQTLFDYSFAHYGLLPGGSNVTVEVATQGDEQPGGASNPARLTRQ